MGGTFALVVAWVAGLVAVAVTLVLMWLLDALHAPAPAIGLIPQLLDGTDLAA